MSGPSLVAVSAGDSPASKTRGLAVAATELHGGGEVIDLLSLSADGLLGRRADAGVDSAVARCVATDVLFIASPTYRATYTGALKAFFDRFPADSLSSTACVLAGTAGIKEHFLSLDTGMRALVASLGGWSVPTVVYAVGDDFVDGEPGPQLRDRIERALGEATSLVSGLPPRP